MNVSVDMSRCSGHGRCYVMAPDVFDMDDNGYCKIKIEEVDGELLEQARIGANNCPEDAISVK